MQGTKNGRDNKVHVVEDMVIGVEGVLDQIRSDQIKSDARYISPLTAFKHGPQLGPG